MKEAPLFCSMRSRAYHITGIFATQPLKEQLYLVYTPAYDPDANRIKWLWRISRRVVTHNHQRRDFELLLADVNAHFQALTQTPDDVLRHIGSPFAPDKEATQPQTLAA
jgi:hypothetical protein